MPDSFVLLEDDVSFVLLEDATSKVILEVAGVVVAGPFCPQKSQVFTAGKAKSQPFTAGAVKSQAGCH